MGIGYHWKLQGGWENRIDIHYCMETIALLLQKRILETFE